MEGTNRSTAGAGGEARNMMPPHRALLAVDTEAYASRPGPAQPNVHRAIFDTLDEALGRAELDTGGDVTCLDDTGDGAIVTVAGEDLSRLLDPVVGELARHLRRREARGEQRLRMRVAVHAGPVDDIEHVGPAKNETARLLNAKQVYEALQRYPKADVALIVSDYAYQVAVRQQFAAALDPDWFAPVDVSQKEYEARAWVYVPGIGRPELDEPANKRAIAQTGETGKDALPASDEHPGAPEARPAQSASGISADRSATVFSHQGTGNQLGGDVHGDLTINQTRADRDVVSGRGDARGDRDRGDRRSGDLDKRSFGPGGADDAWTEDER